jgi:hypothetical protein
MVSSKREGRNKVKDIKAKDLKAEVSAELRRTFKPTTYRDQISVRCICPPIPDRNFDWEATFADYEPGALIGYGITADAAVRDLQDQDYERQADDTYERKVK